MLTVLSDAPAEIVKFLAFKDGILYHSDALKGDAHFLSFISRIRKRRKVTDIRPVPAQDFDRAYGAYSHRIVEDLSDMQNYAVNLLRTAYNKNASDIHIAYYGTYGVIKFRRLGMLREYSTETGNRAKALITVIFSTLAKGRGQDAVTFMPLQRQDIRIVNRDYLPKNVHSIRVHTEPLECAQGNGEPGTLMLLRLLYDRTEAKGGLEERATVLGYGIQETPKLRLLTDRGGLTIISGPTGHGKSTILKHLMEAQAEEKPTKAYMSIEDPPEYPLANVNQILISVNNSDGSFDPEERGKEYTSAIAGAMRSDPDVIMIGEIRYPEAAAASIDASLTGHSVFTTLHANSALGIIQRMESLLQGIKRFANPLEYLCNHNVLAGLVYQRLVPVLCPNCKIPYMLGPKTSEDKNYQNEMLPTETEVRLLNVIDSEEALPRIHIQGRGCEKCDQLGFESMTVAAEIIVTNEVILRHIRRGEYEKAYSFWLKDMKGRTYIQHAIEGIENGLLDPYSTEQRLGVPLDFTRSLGEVTK